MDMIGATTVKFLVSHFLFPKELIYVIKFRK